MTQHQGLPVHGYVPQSEGAVGLVNRNKQLEEEVLRVIDSLAGDSEVDLRWLRIAQTHIEQGFMALNRSIFKPQRLK